MHYYKEREGAGAAGALQEHVASGGECSRTRPTGSAARRATSYALGLAGRGWADSGSGVPEGGRPPPGRRVEKRAAKAELANRGRVKQPAFGPQAVHAALEAERLQVRIEALAVVAHLLHDLERPAVIQAKKLPQVAIRADEALECRSAVFCLL